MWKLFRRRGRSEPSALDYYAEGLELADKEKYHEALTSLRLALRERPGDARILQQMAIVYTRIGMTDEAARVYREVLERDPSAGGAHYGLAFLLLKRGEVEEARRHLKAFLERAPTEPEAAPHVAHARQTLLELETGG
ncbi:MAG: tetratricopeptide repeat protein [Gemmatimonadetes bacterium]|nr:tetratricopeptide repeat protein [Gemmatimonadota bacterium]